ncbi:hypothetical protein [Microbacterium sp.]|uniref:hypothetical protein n=1 Tax=Microbacterium sp. TaxID=51671 RepID=UPI003A8931B4
MRELVEGTVAQRTHSWLRLSLVGAIGVILLAVTVESIRLGEVLPSLSQYYYSPARNIFVGALIAASVALLALSGRNIESVLLDLAAPLAALTALVPTRTVPHAVPASGLACPPGMTACVPVQTVPEVDNGVTVFVVAVCVLIVVGITLVLRLPRGEPGGFSARARVAVATTGAALIVAGVVLAARTPTADGQTVLLDRVHFLAAALFLLMIGAVAVLNAFVRTGQRTAALGERAVDIAIAGLLLADLIVSVWAIWFAPPGSNAVFWVEVVALVLIASFFAVQTITRRADVDALALAARVERLAPLRARR